MLIGQDMEMVMANFKDHVLKSIFHPTIAELVRENPSVKARREKEESRRLIEEKNKRLQLYAPPPWEVEGISHRDWLHNQIAKIKAEQARKPL